ncbi:MAG: sugar phosphate isomerase/epimerase [Candidatus Bathyarchaeia archaeon]
MNDPSRGIVEEVRSIASLGFDYIDLTVEGPRSLVKDIMDRLTAIRDEISCYDLKIVGHTAWFLELAHPYERVRRVFVEEAVEAVDTLAKLGVEKVTFHPFLLASSLYRKQPYRSKLLEALIESLIEVNRRALDNGIRVMVENMDGGRMWRIEEYVRMVDEADVGFHLDIAHANLDVESLNLTAFLDRFRPGDKLLHIHISDNIGGPASKGWDLHLPIGVGSIDWDETFKILRSYGYSGTVTLEVFSKDRDYLKVSLDKVRSLASMIGWIV